MAAFQTMSGLLRKKGSYLFGDRVETKVVRSGKVAGVVVTHGTRLRQHHVGSKAQSTVFYQMYPDASVLVREIVWVCGGAVSERASGCVSASSVAKGDRPHRAQPDVVFIACECELLPHACSAGDAARVVCTHRTSLHAGIRSSLCCT